MAIRHRATLHPGEVLLEEVVKPLGMSVNQLALALGIGATRLNEVVRGRRGITADTALRLARYLGSEPQFWMNLQMQYELDLTASAKLAEIERRVQPREGTA